jgi:hypothetical protein
VTPAPSIRAYVQALCSRTLVLMSGSLSVPFALLGLYFPNAWAKSLFGVMAILALFGSLYFLWRDERRRVVQLEGMVAVLNDSLTPKVKFLLLEDCCHRGSLLAVGVGNPSAKTLDDAVVYIDIPKLGVRNLEIGWMGMAAGKTIGIHHGELPRDHHHTEWFVIAGDQNEQFFLKLAHMHGAQRIEAGTYDAELCVRGRDAITTTARLQFVCESPRTLRARLIDSPH